MVLKYVMIDELIDLLLIMNESWCIIILVESLGSIFITSLTSYWKLNTLDYRKRLVYNGLRWPELSFSRWIQKSSRALNFVSAARHYSCRVSQSRVMRSIKNFERNNALSEGLYFYYWIQSGSAKPFVQSMPPLITIRVHRLDMILAMQ